MSCLYRSVSCMDSSYGGAGEGSRKDRSASRLDQYEDQIRGWVEEGKTAAWIADQLEAGHTTLRSWLRKRDLKTKTAVQQANGGRVIYTDPESEAEILRQQLEEARRTIRNIRASTTANARIAQEIRAAMPEAAEVRFQAPPVRETKLWHPHAHVGLVSDLHAFEVVDPVAVNGLNEYNWEIAQERMWRMRESILSFKENRPYEIDELQLWILGDMISGSIHEELRATNEKPVAVQGVLTGKFLAQWIETFAEYYPKITLYGISGNHPRTDKKPSAKQVYDNFDWVAYQFIEVYLAKYIEAGIVTCNFPEAGSVVADIVGLKYLLAHGDGTRTTMPGVPWGGIMRKFNSLRNEYARPDHDGDPVFLNGMAVGHYHEANIVKGGAILMNGSIKGADEWAMKQFGSSEPPKQILATFDRTKSRMTDTSYLTP